MFHAGSQEKRIKVQGSFSVASSASTDLVSLGRVRLVANRRPTDARSVETKTSKQK